MVVPMKWLKGNIFRSSEQSSRRRSTEEEVKVQRSFKKLFLPSWFLSKNNNSKVNKESESGRNPSPVWQASDSYKYLNFKAPPKDIKKKTECKKISEETSENYDIIKKKEDFKENTKTENIKKENLSKPSSSKNEEFNSEIPVVTIENVNVTYPRMSPCRKIENLNIVFKSPLEKKPLKLSEELLRKTDPLNIPEDFQMEEPGFSQDNNNQKQCCREVISPDKVMLKNDPPIVSIPERRKTFKPRILTMPSGSKTAIFSSTLKNEEYSLCSSRQSSTMSIYPPNNYIDYQRQQLIELNIKEKKLLALKDLISKKQELLYRLKELRQFAIPSPTNDLQNLPKVSSFEESDMDESWNNLFNSTRKSTEMEKIVQNKTRHISRGLVRDLVNKFDSEKIKSTAKKTYKKKCNLDHTFVKMAVNAFENGDTWEAQQILSERGTTTDEDIKIDYSSNYMNSGTSCSSKNKNSFNSNNVVTKLSPNSEMYFPNDKIFSIPDSIYPKNMKHRVKWIRVPSNVDCPFLYEKTYKKCRNSTARFYPVHELYITDSGYGDLHSPASRNL